MLYAAVAISALLFVGINFAARYRWYWVVMTALAGLAFAIFTPPFLTGNLIPVAMWNAFFLCIATIVWLLAYRKKTVMLVLSLASMIGAYALCLPSKLREQEEVARILQRYPYESIENRLPSLPSTGVQPPPHNAERLSGFEQRLFSHIQMDYGTGLQRLHERQVKTFVESWGFGFGRMPPSREYEFERRENTDPAPLQPGSGAYGEVPAATKLSREQLDTLHRDASLDFLNTTRFGHIKDRQNVAGFQSHRFGTVPRVNMPSSHVDGKWITEPTPLEVSRLELVSLLMHKEPGVYLSDRLPQMDALKGVPTRPLDTFETEGLTALKQGEDLHVREDRMLGAIRNVKQCVACHGGERGQLLGAFTYTLRPASK